MKQATLATQTAVQFVNVQALVHTNAYTLIPTKESAQEN